MLDRLVYLVKKQNEIGFNSSGYKLNYVKANVNNVSQKYYIGIEDRKGIIYKFKFQTVNSLYKTLLQYGIDIN